MTASVATGPALWPARVMPAARERRFGRRSIRYVPPNIRDPRIHLSTVIITILAIGIGWLGFRVSIAQIVITMASCGLLEVAITARRTGIVVWPASAFQTATSTALLFRVIGTENGDHWSLHGWHLFVIVGTAGVITKHTIRYRGSHIFNPSNVALVVAFLLLGSQRVEPLDYWWAPMGWPMAAAYLVILAGGLVICGRLKLLGLGAALWVSLAGGLAVLALANHSITTRYSLTPMTGWHFWWIIMTSPEILIFMFFMITDPRTVPEGRVARILYGVAIGFTSALCIAPWETEFGAKVGLLTGLLLICITRPLFDRYLPQRGSPEDDPVDFVRRLLPAERRAPRLAAGTAATVAVLAAISVAGVPARAEGADAGIDPPVAAELAPFDVTTLPEITIDPRVAGISAPLATQEGARQLVAALAANLDVEAQALERGDASLLPAVSDGARLRDMTELVEQSPATDRVISTYMFDELHLTIVFPGGFQRGPNAGVCASGTEHLTTLAADGTVVERTTRPYRTMFALRLTTSGRWLNTITLPCDESET